jgi:hypothetical protein
MIAQEGASLTLDGQFYPTFTADGLRYSDADKQCMQRTVEHLLAIQTSAERPGMLLEKRKHFLAR